MALPRHWRPRLTAPLVGVSRADGGLGWSSRRPDARPAPTVVGVYATAEVCQEALEETYGPRLRQLDATAMGGKNPAQLVQRSPNKYHWKVGMPGNRNVYEAWCSPK
jgi:hypothetical protein